MKVTPINKEGVEAICQLAMIDDNPIEHMLVKKMCQTQQIFSNATHFSDARIMLQQLEVPTDCAAQTPDVILLDLQMPEFNGWDFLQRFGDVYKSLAKKVHVYVFSSSIDPADKERSKSFPFVSDFISKPMRKETLNMIYQKHAFAA